MSESTPESLSAGALLRAAREKQGLHIAALAASIKVTPRKLDALEHDRWDELPDATFTRALAQASEDHERARAALQAGEVLSLQKVLEKIQRSHPGELLEAELEREHGRWVYELKLLQKGGVLMRLDVDAKTGEVLKSRQRSGQGSPQAQPETRKSP